MGSSVLHRSPVTRRSVDREAGWAQPLLLLLRLLILGIGLGLITGTALRLLAPRLSPGSTPLLGLRLAPPTLRPSQGLGRFEPRLEDRDLSARLARIAATQKDLTVGAFVLVLDDGRYAELQPDRPLPAASSIKTPILLAALEAVDQGRARPDEKLPLTKTVIGGGSGWMGAQPVGSRFGFDEVATEMIRVSDNTATNLLIERLGGKESLNRRFEQLGLTGTVIRNWLPDLEGTNTTTARDQARTIALVETGRELSPRGRDRFRSILGTSGTDTLIPSGWLRGAGGAAAAAGNDVNDGLLSRGLRVLNKTGDIGTAYIDSALIELPDGRRAVASFMVKGPFNDPRSTDMIRALAAAASQSLSR
jgi:beta-lactamase class A